MTTNPTPQQLAAAEQTIADFLFWDYGMDDVTDAIRNDRAAQEWIADLAAKVAAAVVGAGESA